MYNYVKTNNNIMYLSNCKCKKSAEKIYTMFLFTITTKVTAIDGCRESCYKPKTNLERYRRPRSRSIVYKPKVETVQKMLNQNKHSDHSIAINMYLHNHRMCITMIRYNVLIHLTTKHG